jgi:hypothetical protein
MTRCILAVAILSVIGPALPVSVAAQQRADRFAGRPVADVLRELQEKGAPIIFSDRLVGPNLRVKAEPRRTSGMRELAEDILAPHGLALANGPRGSWLVVRASKSPAPEPDRSKPLPQADPGTPPRSPVRIEENVEVMDRAGDVARSPNVYTVAAAKVAETAGGLENVFQSLPGLPGIAATKDHDGTFSVRGGGPEHNSVLFEGVQIHRPQRIASDLAGQQSFVNPATVESLAVDASGLDARYGGRLSSATLFETRNGSTGRRLAVSGSAGLTSGDVLLEGRLPHTTTGSWWATVRGTYYKVVADRFKDGDIPSFLDFQFKVAVKPSSNTSLSLVGLTGGETMVRPILSPPDQRQSLAGDNLREFHGNTQLAIAKLQWTPGPRVSTTTTVNAYTNMTRTQDASIDWKTGVPFDRRIEVDDVGAHQRLSVAWSSGVVLDAGAELHRIRSSWAMQALSLVPSRSIGPDTLGRRIEYDGPIDARLVRTAVGAWVQQSLPIPGVVVVEPGVRVDWNTWTDETAVQPRLRLTRTIGRRSVLWGGLAWQAQTPGFETMQHGIPYYDLAGPLASDVRNEQMRQVVVGLDRMLPSAMTIRVEAYHRRFERLLVQRVETAFERQQRLALYDLPPDMPPDSAILEFRPTVDPESVGEGRASGLEVLLDRNRGRVTGWISYTLSKSDRELFGRTVPFDFERRHALTLAVNVILTSKVRASVRSQHASGFPITPLHEEVVFNDDPNRFPGPPPGTLYRPARRADGSLFMHTGLYDEPRISLLNSTRVAAYGRTDVRITYTIDKRFEAYGEIVNLFDRENFEVVLPDVTGPNGRSVTYRFAPAFPRLLTYGVRFKF